ncbi:MAG: S8 family serine peptidase, partial [Sideroxydans sp.]
MQRLRLMTGALVLSLLCCDQLAQAAPVVVSVDHRVTVTYSKVEFNAAKGIYTTLVRIRNRSGSALFSPLRLALDQAALGDIRLVNEQGVGNDGLPYFELALPKGVLSAGRTTAPVKVVFFIGKDKGDSGKGKLRRTGKDAELRRVLAAASSVSAGVELAPLTPRAEPYALKAGDGEVKVRFSVALAGKASASTSVYLRRSGDRKSIAMNDNGRDGDVIARDGIYGVSVPVDTSRLKPDSCLGYEAYTGSGRAELVSPSLKLCASSFPVRVAASDTAKPVVLPDGTKAVGDEILITSASNVRSDAIRRLAADIGAEVAGSIPPLNFYQLKLSAPVSATRLAELVAQLGKHPGVKAVSVNAIGSYAYTPSDPEFVNQHGLQRVRAHDVWDTGATGNGVTITILDTGLDKSHLDFGSSPANCQLAENDCGAANTDPVGHGTWVAGVVGARTNNALGVAGVAYGSKIHSIVVGGAAPTIAQMTQGFTNAAAYGVASVINASFDVLASNFTNVTSLCASVNSAVLSGATPVAVVVNASGNSSSNSYYYPGRCNVNEPAATPHAGQNE